VSQLKYLLPDVVTPSDKAGGKPAARKSSSASSVLKDFEKTIKQKLLSSSSIPQLGRGLAADCESVIDLDDIPYQKTSATDHAKVSELIQIRYRYMS